MPSKLTHQNSNAVSPDVDTEGGGSSRSVNYRGGFGYRCLREPFADCS